MQTSGAVVNRTAPHAQPLHRQGAGLASEGAPADVHPQAVLWVPGVEVHVAQQLQPPPRLPVPVHPIEVLNGVGAADLDSSSGGAQHISRSLHDLAVARGTYRGQGSGWGSGNTQDETKSAAGVTVGN